MARTVDRGLSTALSTVILSATILTISIFSAYLATDLFEGQNQQAEYDQGKDQLYALAVAVDSVAPRDGAASYVRFNPRAGGPGFVRSWGHITVDISNTTYSVRAVDEDLNAILYRGGYKATVGSMSILRGDKTQDPQWYANSLVLVPGSSPLTWVYTQQYQGAKIWLEASRTRLTNLGTFTYSKQLPNGTLVSDVVNVAEVLFTRLPYGYTTGGSSVIDMKVRCESVNTLQYRFGGTSGSSVTVSVTVTLNNPQFTSSPQTYSSQRTISSGGRPIVVYLVVSNVVVYMLGG